MISSPSTEQLILDCCRELLEEVLLCEFDLCNAECAATERDILSKFCFRILR